MYIKCFNHKNNRPKSSCRVFSRLFKAYQQLGSQNAIYVVFHGLRFYRTFAPTFLRFNKKINLW